MFVDKESHLPGKDETASARTTTIRFSASNLMKNWAAGHGCPIYHALKDAGVEGASVNSVGYALVTPTTIALRLFKDDLRSASDFLAMTNAWPLRLLRLPRLWRREFEVAL